MSRSAARQRPTLLDTGPLVAYLNRRDRYHGWACDQLASIQPPLLTCEAVISEACFLLRRRPTGPIAVLELMQRGLLLPSFQLSGEHDAISKLMLRYQDRPMAFADACLVRMAQRNRGSKVLTLDRDFMFYRLAGRRPVPAILPLS